MKYLVAVGSAVRFLITFWLAGPVLLGVAILAPNDMSDVIRNWWDWVRWGE